VVVNARLNIAGNNGKTLDYFNTQFGRHLINNGIGTWSGSAVGGQAGAVFLNNGSLTLSNDVGFFWAGTGALPAFQNNGTFTKVAGAGVATFSSTSITNTGIIAINSGGLTVGGVFIQTAGDSFLGTNFTANSDVWINAGSLTGQGTIAGAFYNNGVVNPGASPGFIIGNSFTNTAAATYTVEIGGNNGPGTNYDQMRFAGRVTLAGTLNVTLYTNYQLILSNRFTVLTTLARTGTFANVIPPPGAAINTIYSSTNVVLEIAGLTNAIPVMTLHIPTGTNSVVCRQIRAIASGTDADGVVTNIDILVNSSLASTRAGSSVTNLAEADSPMTLTFVARGQDDRNGFGYATQQVTIVNYSLTNVLFLGGVRTNDFKLCLVGEPGRDYEVYGITNLPATNWTDLGTMLQAGGTWHFTDQRTVTNWPYRFYRTQQLP
jgi:hypothetical protein